MWQPAAGPILAGGPFTARAGVPQYQGLGMGDGGKWRAPWSHVPRRTGFGSRFPPVTAAASRAGHGIRSHTGAITAWARGVSILMKQAIRTRTQPWAGRG